MFLRPSLIKTPIVTAGLKCPPLTGPRIEILAKRVKPTDIGWKLAVARFTPQLTAIMRVAVPIISYKQTINLF